MVNMGNMANMERNMANMENTENMENIIKEENMKRKNIITMDIQNTIITLMFMNIIKLKAEQEITNCLDQERSR